MTPDLDALVQETRAGKLAAYDQLVELLHHDVAGFVGARLPVPAVVEEVVQDAFVLAYERLATYECRGTFAAWVKGFARNLILRRCEAFAKHEGRSEAVEAALAKLALTATAAECDVIDEQWERRSARLASCLQRLPAQARQLLTLRYIDAVPLAHMAQRLQRTVAALANQLTRVKDILRNCLDAQTSESTHGR